MQTTETMTGNRNWAPIIHAELAAINFTVHGLPKYVTRDEACAILSDLSRQLKAMKA